MKIHILVQALVVLIATCSVAAAQEVTQGDTRTSVGAWESTPEYEQALTSAVAKELKNVARGEPRDDPWATSIEAAFRDKVHQSVRRGYSFPSANIDVFCYTTLCTFDVADAPPCNLSLLEEVVIAAFQTDQSLLEASLGTDVVPELATAAFFINKDEEACRLDGVFSRLEHGLPVIAQPVVPDPR